MTRKENRSKILKKIRNAKRIRKEKISLYTPAKVEELMGPLIKRQLEILNAIKDAQ